MVPGRQLDDILAETRRIALLDETGRRLAAVRLAGPDDGFHGRVQPFFRAPNQAVNDS